MLRGVDHRPDVSTPPCILDTPWLAPVHDVASDRLRHYHDLVVASLILHHGSESWAVEGED